MNCNTTHYRANSSSVPGDPTGSGKSTLLGLLLGTHRPERGEVEVTTHAGLRASMAEEEELARLRRSIGYVGPEALLIEGTVLDNISYGLSQPAGLAEVERALALAECGFVAELPLGLQHRLSEQGSGLSAGQKQRLSLARALLRAPAALILDEPTSNLDLETEARLVETLGRLKGSLTIVVVTHRPALRALSDQTVSLPARTVERVTRP